MTCHSPNLTTSLKSWNSPFPGAFIPSPTNHFNLLSLVGLPHSLQPLDFFNPAVPEQLEVESGADPGSIVGHSFLSFGGQQGTLSWPRGIDFSFLRLKCFNCFGRFSWKFFGKVIWRRCRLELDGFFEYLKVFLHFDNMFYQPNEIWTNSKNHIYILLFDFCLNFNIYDPYYRVN